MDRHRNRDKERRAFRALLQAESGAVAATYALALFALIGVAGVGFDYARLAAMDTELQNAADQSALAAATQLDGQADSMTRATNAASNLVSNNTLLSNDGNGTTVGIDADLKFYATRAAAEAETPETTNPAEARFVRVSITAREAFYALTPVVGAIRSGDVDAHATAGVGSAICKTPPVMMCNPGVNPSMLDIEALKGKGVLLKLASADWEPGDFGFLDVGAGADDLGKLMAYVNPPGECVSTDTVSTEPGAKMSVMDALNVRFGIYDGGDGNMNCYGSGNCPPSDNSHKDMVQELASSTPKTSFSEKDCATSTAPISEPTPPPPGKKDKYKTDIGWMQSPNPYRPTEVSTYSSSGKSYPDQMGYPRDICHAVPEGHSGRCGRIGNGTWDIDAYWHVNHKEPYTGTLGSKPTRYEVYQWERNTPPKLQPFQDPVSLKWYQGFSGPVCPSGTANTFVPPDRRVIPVAVMDCTNFSGKESDKRPLDFVDVFLVEPSVDRYSRDGKVKYTSKGDIYVEVIGRTGQGTGGSAPQVVRRDKPYLVR